MSTWSSYTPSSLSTWITTHLPHYDESLHPVSPEQITPSYVMDQHTTTYLTSLGILGILLFSWFLIYLLLELFIRCIFYCYPCCQRKHSLTHHKQRCRRYIVSVLCAILCCGGLAASYHQHMETIHGMDKVHSSLNSISSFQHSFIHDLKHVKSLLSDASSMMEVMLYPINPHDTLPNNIYQMLYDSQGLVNTTQSTLDTVHQTATTVTLNETLKIIHDEEQYRNASVLSLLTLLVVMIFVLMIIYWYFTHLSSRSRTCVQLLILLMLGITLLYACVLISVSLGASDICQQPDTYADYAIHKYTSNDESRLIIQYYLHCISGDINPIQKKMDDANTYVQELMTGVQLLNDTLWYTNITIAHDDSPYITQLNDDAMHMKLILNHTMHYLSCATIHDDYLNARDATCGELLNGCFIGGVILGITIIIFLIFRLCLHPRLPTSPVDEDIAYVPLSQSPTPSSSTSPPPYSPPTPAAFYTYATPQNRGYVTDPLHVNAWTGDDHTSTREGEPHHTSNESYYFYSTTERR